MRAAGAALALCCGCSLLFDPAKAPPAPCPIAADGCPAEPNAVAFCSDGGCAYTCPPGFVDDDGDLGRPGSNGCEVACGDACAPPAPPRVDAVVGPVSGGMDLFWPDLPAGAPEAARVDRYRLYAGSRPDAVSAVLEVARSSCDAGACTGRLTGLPNNVRRYVQVRAVDRFGNESDAGAAPAISATPLNGDGTSWADWTLDNACASAIFATDGGAFEIKTQLLCISAAYAGDDGWGSYTLDVEVKVHATLGPNDITGGPTLWSGQAGMPRVQSATVLPCSTGADAPTSFRTDFGGLAGAVACAPYDTWYALHLVAQSGLASLGLGLNGAPPVELVRWRAPAGAATSGRIGLGATGYGGVVQFRNLRVSTRADLPDAGPTAERVDFSQGLPPSVRIVTDPGASAATGPCPSLPAAPGCDAGACLDAGSGCLRILSAAPVHAAAAFALPLGLDPLQDYAVRFGFATLDAGASSVLLRSEAGVLLDAPDGGLSLRWLGQPVPGGLAAGVWNSVEIHVTPSDGGASLRWNGAPPLAGPFGFNWSPELSPLVLGTPVYGGPMDGVYTAIDVTAN